MSQSIQRGVRRLQAIQESRNIAWILLAVMLPIAVFSLIELISRLQNGMLVSVGGGVSAVVFVSAGWVAVHLFRETRRLGRLLRDPGRIMRLERDPDLVEGIQWSGFLPFSNWRS